VQAHHVFGRLLDVRRPMARRQAVTTSEPGSALGDVDASHPGILARASDRRHRLRPDG